MSLLPLLGVLVVVLGFAARINPLLVVMAAAIVSGLASGLDFVAVISAFGKAFNDNRYVSVTWLVLPVIGALERGGLQERARDMIVRQRTRDGHELDVPGVVPKLSATPGTLRTSAPRLGDDTDGVLASAGYSAADIAALHQKGVVA